MGEKLVQLDKLLTVTEVADRLGVQPQTIRRYKSLGLMPEPDAVVNRSPLWTLATVDDWVARRPGRGTGGGRPAHRKAVGRARK